jgi:hypothetical protein
MEDDADTVYIEYLNKDRGFVRDKKVFSGDTAYEDAVQWARENLERFSPDMIKYGSITEQSRHGYTHSTPASQFNENRDSVESAIMYRLLHRHLDVIQRHGPESATLALQDVLQGIPDDLEEIGSSDVSIWVNQVLDSLESGQYDTMEHSHVQSFQESTDEDEQILSDPQHPHYYPVAMGTLIAHARQLSDAVKAYNKFRKPDGVDLPQDELGKINIYAVSDNQWKSVINAVNDLDDFIADHRSKGAQKIAKAGFDL